MSDLHLTGAAEEADKEARQLVDLVMLCAHAVTSGSPTVTVVQRGMRPLGFPRGELLSVGTDGSKNFAMDPVKLFAWLHSRTRPHEARPACAGATS